MAAGASMQKEVSLLAFRKVVCWYVCRLSGQRERREDQTSTQEEEVMQVGQRARGRIRQA